MLKYLVAGRPAQTGTVAWWEHGWTSIIEVLKKACVIDLEDVARKAMGVVLVGTLSMLIRSW